MTKCRLCNTKIIKGERFCTIEHEDMWNKQKKTLKDFGCKKGVA